MTKRPVFNPINRKGFKDLVHQTLDKWHVPGMAIAVIDGDDTWSEGYGFAKLPSTPVTPSTLFYAGSTTKAFSAAMIAKLIEDPTRDIEWDTPVTELLPGDFSLTDKTVADQITIEDALSHRTGLPGHDHASAHTNVRENVRRIAHLPMTAKPRTRYQYNNLMYVVASRVIESATGQWLGDSLARCFWQPLGMTDTRFSLKDALAGPAALATGYYYPGWRGDSQDEKAYREVDWMPLEEVSGAGSVITNVLDYTKWVRAFLRPETFVEKGIFKSEDTVRQLWEPRTLMPSDAPFTGPRAYCLAWRTGVYQGVQFFEHTGGMNAFGAQLLLVPKLQFAVIILANTSQTSNFAAQRFHLLDERLGVPESKRFDWNRRNWSVIEKEQKRVAEKMNYKPPIYLQPTLALNEYAGTYTHAGYKTILVYLDNEGVLRADRKDMTWPEAITFRHVTGEHFLMVSEHNEDYGAFCPDVYDAEFRIDVEEKAWTLGVAWERAMEGEKIWFQRT